MMDTRPNLSREATRYLKAARQAGYSRAKFVSYPDGRIEVTAEADDNHDVKLQTIDQDHDAIIKSRLDALG